VIASITRLIFRITNSVKDSHHKENAWLMVLAFVPTDNYNIPRWHIDPFYFLPEETPLKFIATLKGPSTLFYFLPEERRKEFALLNPYHHENWRDVFDPSRVTQAKKGEGAFFITGNMDRGAVHSEPPIHEERIIFSVIPANEEELEMLRRNWKK
jgi:hypothetical protein